MGGYWLSGVWESNPFPVFYPVPARVVPPSYNHTGTAPSDETTDTAGVFVVSFWRDCQRPHALSDAGLRK